MTTIDNEPWFVAADVCRILSCEHAIRIAGVSQYTKHIDAEDRRVLKHKELVSQELIQGGTRAPSLVLISESVLYKLVMRSDKPQAKEFRNWVTKVVLPAIRKDGREARQRVERAPRQSAFLG